LVVDSFETTPNSYGIRRISLSIVDLPYNVAAGMAAGYKLDSSQGVDDFASDLGMMVNNLFTVEPSCPFSL
jgi:hypothetical protein